MLEKEKLAMSNRPKWFSSVVAVLVFTVFVSSILVAKLNAQDLLGPVSASGEKSKWTNDESKGIVDDLFPVMSGKPFMIGSESSDLINATTYPFTPLTAVSLEDMASGTTQLVAASQDDTASAVTNIGFDVWFDGVRYTQFSVNANGLMRFGPTVVGNAASGRTNDWATTTDQPKVAAYWDDLCTAANGKVHYKVVGSPGSRRLVVEWLNEVTFGTTCANGLAIGTFQVWVYEPGAASQAGAIQFVYGALGANSSANLGYGMGMGSSNTSFASVTQATDTVSYAASDNAQTGAVAAGKSYQFNPNVPLQPTNLNFSMVTAVSQQLTWNDNSSNELGFVIYRSTDGTNFSFLTQVGANVNTFGDTGLSPSTNYFYRVYAVSEGAFSIVLPGSNSTDVPGNDSCNGAGGNWSSTGTWTDGTVPTAGDNVTIGSGCTVTVDVANAVAINVTIDSGGTLQSPTSGTVTTNNLTVSGNVTNNGTLDFSTNADTSGAILTFGAGAPTNVSFSGTGAVTDVRAITVAKGAIATAVELSTTNFTVRGVNTDVAGYLTITSGTFKISGTFAVTNRTFTTATYTIPATGGIWLNNPNYVIAATASAAATSNNGLLRVSQGIYNIGIGAGDQMRGGVGAAFTIEGGVVNVAGAFDPQSAVTYTQSGGVMNVGVVGNSVSNFGTFELFSTTSSFIMSGGTINIINPSTGTTKVDYRNQAPLANTNITGGSVVIGGAGAPASSIYTVSGTMPDTTVNATHTMRVNNAAVFMRGSTVTNAGTIDFTGASARYDFANQNGPMTYGGGGVFGTAAVPFGGVGISANGLGSTTVNSPIFVNRINLFSGGFVNSNQITLGAGAATTTVVQVGNSTTPTAAGTFDVSPIYNTGTGGHIVLHLRTTTLNRPTGFEINPSRTLVTWTIDNDAVGGTYTVAGGDITLTGVLTLTNGVVATGANTITHNGTAARTNGYVNGNLARSFTATGAYTYHVGQNGYSPVAASITALGTNPSTLSVRPTDGTLPGLILATSVSRYWSLAESGDLTADIGFTYLDADINGNEADYRVYKSVLGTITNMCSGGPCVNAGTNTASVTGITDFSDWGVGENGAIGTPGAVAFSAPTYTVGEAGPSAALTVNRTGGSTGSISVDYAFSGGSATGGSACGGSVDYDNDGGTLNFADGETSKNINVPICNDAVSEGDETFNATLSNATGGATIGSPNPATVTITDDDAPAGGPVTVTATAGTTGPTDYPTVKAAIDAINAGTHQGDITVSIVSNTTETATSVLNAGTGAAPAAYTSVLIRPVNDGVTVAGPSVQGRGLIELNGADNVTIDGDNPNSGGTNRNLTIQNTAANTVTFTSVIRIALAAAVTTADGNTFKNLNILGSATGRNIGTANTTTGTENNGFGILSGLGATGATTAPAAITSVTTGAPSGTTATTLVVNNNSVMTVARGISINGAAATVYPGLQVTGNTIGNPIAGNADQVYAIGITAQGSSDGLISGNTVWVEGFAPTGLQGINVSTNSTVGTFTVELNKVNRVRNSNITTFGAYGINLGGSTNHVVRNNFVSGVMNDQTAGTGAFSTTFGAFGIRVLGTGAKIYHNSVNMYGALPGTVSTDLTAALCIVGTTQTGVDVRNNIFSNQITGGNPTGTRNVAVFLPTGGTSTMNLTWNNNAYFVGTDAQNRLAQRGTTFGTGEYLVADFDPTQTTPATNFRNYTSSLSAAGTNDDASFATTAAPPFTSNVDLHIPAGTATRLESGGAAVGVTTDIDAESRNATTPDIGADEFAGNPPPANDIAASGFVVPLNGSTIPTGNTFGPQARFANFGTATQTSVTVRFRIIDSSMAEIYNQTATIASIAPLQQVVVTFPSTSIATPGTYSMVASSELAGDSNTANDSINGTFNAVAPVGGTVTVGTGGDFTSLTNAGGLFQALNLAGISGNLTVNITSDLTGETGAVPLNQLVETGAGGYTVTFKPFGAARTISGTGAASNGIINLNGADRIVFDGSLSGGTDRSLTITNSQTGTSTIFWIKSANAANGANNNTIKNMIMSGTGTTTAQTTAGILAGSGVTIGGPAEAPNNNNTVTNNHIFGVQNALYNQGNTGLDQGWAVTNNEFGSTVEANKNRFRGMLMGNANNFTISGNTVLGVTNFDGTTGANTGIQIAFAVTNGTITNNRISNVHNLSTAGTGAFGMQLGATPTTNIVIANNFIWDIQANGSATVTSNGHGITINGAATAGGYKIYHNSINMNTNQVTAGTSAALNITSVVVAAGALDVRNNIFSNTQTTGTRFGVFSAAAANVFATIDYNDYFAQNVGSLGGTRTTLAEWQTATGQDVNSKAVDPLFVSPTDLHLQATSTLLGMGVAGTGITTDIDGQTRDTPPDIGADEILAGATPGSVQFSTASTSVGENGGSVTLTVTRTGGTGGAISVNYATANGTATGGASCAAGIDFVNANGTLNWADGDGASKTFDVTICNDATFELDETFTAGLSGATGGATIGTPSTETVTIENDDAPPAGSFTISDVRVTEGNVGAVNATFTVTFVGSGSGSINYATANGTAVAGADYLATSGTLNFTPAAGIEGPAPSSSQTVTVVVISDVAKEANETFFVNLSSPTGGSIVDGTGVGIIVDEDRAYVADFDRDLRSDVSVFRPSEGNWYVLETTSGSPRIVTFGLPTDLAVPGDYDGDGETDVAIWRPSTGQWFRILSGSGTNATTNWGTTGDLPVQGDYDGDGKVDLAIYRPSTGSWWVLQSSDGGTNVQNFGLSSDLPVQADYDGDAKTDRAVFRNGTWYIRRSTDGGVTTANWGLAGDQPVSGDFDGDGSFDLAIYRVGTWWVRQSLTGTVRIVNLGTTTDIPVPADYDGDGTSDFGVFRPSTGDWYILRSSGGGVFGPHWGQSGDVPLPSVYQTP